MGLPMTGLLREMGYGALARFPDSPETHVRRLWRGPPATMVGSEATLPNQIPITTLGRRFSPLA